MRRDLRITHRDALGWVVIDKTDLPPCSACGVPVLFASTEVDHCHAWLSRQRDGAPALPLRVTRSTLARTWRVEDAAGAVLCLAKTKALAKDCARIVKTNPPALEGVTT